MPQIGLPWKEGYDYGIGVDLADGDPKNRGIKGPVSMVENAAGSVGQFSLARIETTSDIEESLGISASASGGAGLLSGSARFSFAKKARVQSYSLFLTMVNSDYTFQQIDEPAFTDDAISLISDPGAFATRYGNHFVRGMKTGGIFVGWIRIEADSAEERSNIDAALGGSYGLFSASASVQKSDAIKNVSNRISADMYHEGGGALQPVSTADQLFAACKTWADNIRASAHAYEITLAPYDIALGAPRAPNAIDLQHQQDVLAECSRLRSRTWDKMNIVEYLLEHPSEFAPARQGGPDLAHLHAGLSTDLDVIARAASYAMRNPIDAVLPETFAREKDQTRRPNYVLTEITGPLPEHIGSHVSIPDFLQLNSFPAPELERQIDRLAQQNNLKVEIVFDSQGPTATNMVAKILKQDPVAGSGGVRGVTTVHLQCHPMIMRLPR